MLRALLALILLANFMFTEAQAGRSLTTANGLEENNVYPIARDKDGNMWFLADTLGNNKLCRVDNEHERVITIEGVTDGKLRHLFIDSSSRIWMASHNRLHIYDTSSGTQEQFSLPTESDILCGAETDSLNVVVATEDGKFHISRKDGKWQCTTDTAAESPWWASTPALAAYLLLVMAAIYAVYLLAKSRNKRRMEEDKVRFFMQTAHEIRTPLSLIKAPLEEISRKEKLSERGNQNIQTALRSANDLLILTSDLLNAERQKMHSDSLRLYETDLTTYLQELVIPFQMYARTKHLDLVYSSDASVKVWIDRSRMDSIMQNIINNALKYTPSNGSIMVSTDVSETKWTVRVSDTGIGIPKSEREKLTQMYFRSSNADKTSGGTGVGLFLVKKLVEEHQGTVEIVSEEGRGTTFTLSFPTDYETNRRVVKMIPKDDTPPSVNGLPTVLIVDDNAEMRTFISNSLAGEYNIYTAENGSEAYSKVRFLHPDIIVSDVMMKQMRGDELCRKIKSEVETSHIPVILLSALADNESVIEGLTNLADAYLIKPFSVDELKEKMHNLITNMEELQKVYSGVATSSEETEENEMQTEEGQPVPDAMELNFINNVNAIIEKNMGHDDFTVDTLCTIIGMSRTSFYNKLKTLTGYPPADFVRIKKIEKAKQLLRSTQLTIQEISDNCGFADAKYFREVFKKNVGESPRQFRTSQH